MQATTRMAETPSLLESYCLACETMMEQKTKREGYFSKHAYLVWGDQSHSHILVILFLKPAPTIALLHHTSHILHIRGFGGLTDIVAGKY